MVKSRVFPLLLKQFLMGSSFDDRALFEHDNPVRPANRRESMGDDKRCASCGEVLQSFHQALFGFCVKRAGRFIQYENGGVFEKRASYRDSLSLASGERRAALADHGLVTLR